MSELIIKRLAKEKGVSMDEVASAAGYRQRTSLYQKMKRNGLRTDQLEGIASTLKVSIRELFADDRPPRQDTCTLTCPHCGKSFTIKIEKI